MSRPRLSHIGSLSLVMLMAAGIRLAYVYFLPGQEGNALYSDMWIYDQSGWCMARGRPLPEGVLGFNGYHPLSASTYYYAGYTYFVAAVYALCGHSPLAVRLVQGIISTATVALVYVVGIMVFGRRPALLAALLTALHLPQVYYAGLLLTETWFTFLQMAALAVWLAAWGAAGRGQGSGARGQGSGIAGFGTFAADQAGSSSLTVGVQPQVLSLSLAFVAGVLAGLGCITRAASLPAIASIALGAILWPTASMGRARSTSLAGAFLLGALVVIPPVTIRNFQIHGRFILVSTNGPNTFWYGRINHTAFVPEDEAPAGTNDAELARINRQRSLRYLREHWPTYLAEVPEHFLAIFCSTDFWPHVTTYWSHPRVHQLFKLPQDQRTRLELYDARAPSFGRITHFPDLMRYTDAVLWLLLGLPLGLLAAFFLPSGNRRWVFVYLTLLAYLLIPFLAPAFARYRIPAVPLVFILAGQTACALWDCRRRARSDES